MKRWKKKELAHAFIAIKVEDYSVRTNAGINVSLLGTPHLVGNRK